MDLRSFFGRCFSIYFWMPMYQMLRHSLLHSLFSIELYINFKKSDSLTNIISWICLCCINRGYYSIMSWRMHEINSINIVTESILTFSYEMKLFLKYRTAFLKLFSMFSFSFNLFLNNLNLTLLFSPFCSNKENGHTFLRTNVPNSRTIYVNISICVFLSCPVLFFISPRIK